MSPRQYNSWNGSQVLSGLSHLRLILLVEFGAQETPPQGLFSDFHTAFTLRYFGFLLLCRGTDSEAVIGIYDCWNPGSSG